MQRLHHPDPSGERNPATMPLQRERLGQDSLGSGAPGSVLADSVPASLQLAVRYKLSEYVGFTWQHCGYLIRRRRIGAFATWWMCSKSTASAALHFIAQGRARRTYEFTIDGHGIVRTSGSGVTLVPWRDVRAIRRYAGGYMIVLARGTLPIPLRCLDRAQIAAMDGFATLVRAARH